MIQRKDVGVAKRKAWRVAYLIQPTFFTTVRKKRQQYLPFVSQCRDNVTEPFYDPGGARVVDLVRRIR